MTAQTAGGAPAITIYSTAVCPYCVAVSKSPKSAFGGFGGSDALLTLIRLGPIYYCLPNFHKSALGHSDPLSTSPPFMC